MQLWCQKGQHLWERPAARGRPPKSCPEHSVARDAEIWCETGQHGWHPPFRRGPQPASCPEHTARSAPARGGWWIGDLKRCFLLDTGWSFRVPVNRFLLAGRAWPIPVTVAEAIGLHGPGSLILRPVESGADPDVTVSRTASACHVGAIDRPLRRLGAVEEDVAFFCYRERRYDVLLRRHRELDEADALGRLLWTCGMEPSDDRYRHEPWHCLARALGATGATREAVRRRLDARRDHGLLELLASVQPGRGSLSPRGWPEGWQYVCPLDEEWEGFALLGSDGRRRVAAGVIDVSGQPDDGLVVTDGGLAWVEDDQSGDVDGSVRAGRESLRGLIPAARKPAWSRWLYAEHRLRVAGLSGSSWSVSRGARGWLVDGVDSDSLLAALERLAPRDAVPDPPAEPAREPYPRSALAFERALADAETRGLMMLSADPRSGIRGSYASGREMTGSALLDVLAGQ